MKRAEQIKLFCVLVGALGVALLLFSDIGPSRTVQAFSSGPQPGLTGAAGEQTCVSCHSGSGAPATGTFTIEVPDSYQPGVTYELRVRHTSSDPTRKRWGFQLTALTGDNQRAGDLQVEEDNTQILNDAGPGGNRQYIEHNLQGTFNGRTGGAVWSFFWQAPATNVGPVTFYAAGNQANGDSENTGDDIFTARAVSQPPANPIDDATFFVTQCYLDYLARPPDPDGLAFWTTQITQCGSDFQCIQQRRVAVATAFFYSSEFDQTAFFDYGVYQVSYGRPPTFPEFVSDMSALGLNAPGTLAEHRQTFLDGFTQTANFRSIYAVLSNTQYVDALLARSSISITPAERAALITGLDNGSETRGSVLGKLADDPTFRESHFKAALVLLEYFGSLRRSADDEGYAFWLTVINQPGGQELVVDVIRAFLFSAEYRARFGPP